MEKTLAFKWTVSRGQDTYGYNIVSLWINRQKVSSCNGGGYDMQGPAIAEWMKQEFSEKLKKLTGFYGLSFYNTKRKKLQKTWSKDCNVHLDGACGFSCMERILEKMKFKIRFIHAAKNENIYSLTGPDA